MPYGLASSKWKSDLNDFSSPEGNVSAMNGSSENIPCLIGGAKQEEQGFIVFNGLLFLLRPYTSLLLRILFICPRDSGSEYFVRVL
jgi:hypothetical protein